MAERKPEEMGSLTNELLARSTRGEPTPVVGMGATILHWTDRQAGTIVAVRRFASGTREGEVSEIDVQPDRTIRVDGNGMSEVQTYRYEADPTAPVQTFQKLRSGRWCSKQGGSLAIGHRDAYHDYSF